MRKNKSRQCLSGINIFLYLSWQTYNSLLSYKGTYVRYCKEEGIYEWNRRQYTVSIVINGCLTWCPGRGEALRLSVPGAAGLSGLHFPGIRWRNQVNKDYLAKEWIKYQIAGETDCRVQYGSLFVCSCILHECVRMHTIPFLQVCRGFW